MSINTVEIENSFELQSDYFVDSLTFIQPNIVVSQCRDSQVKFIDIEKAEVLKIENNLILELLHPIIKWNRNFFLMTFVGIIPSSSESLTNRNCVVKRLTKYPFTITKYLEIREFTITAIARLNLDQFVVVGVAFTSKTYKTRHKIYETSVLVVSFSEFRVVKRLKPQQIMQVSRMVKSLGYDDCFYLSVGEEFGVFRINAENDTTEATFNLQSKSVLAIEVFESSDGNELLLVGGKFSNLLIYDTREDNKLLQKISSNEYIYSMKSIDKKIVSLGTTRGYLQFIDLDISTTESASSTTVKKNVIFEHKLGKRPIFDQAIIQKKNFMLRIAVTWGDCFIEILNIKNEHFRFWDEYYKLTLSRILFFNSDDFIKLINEKNNIKLSFLGSNKSIVVPKCILDL